MTKPAARNATLNLADFEQRAARFLPRPLLEYVAGGVEDNLSRRANRDAFAQWQFVPRVLVDVSKRSAATTLFGQGFSMPCGIAPMGISALVAYDGDRVLARAAAAANVPMIVSGASLTRLEDVHAVAPDHAWFQAYVPGEDAHIEALIDRVARAGYRTLVITVDTATRANRENNIRAGFTTPLRPSLRLAWDGVTRPHWLMGSFARTLLKRGMPHFENQSATRGVPVLSSAAERQFGLKEHLNWQHLAGIRKAWRGNLVVKGILSSEDARLAVEHGAQGIIVSNHGGRQLDGSLAPLDALPEIVAALRSSPDVAIMIDSGFRRGTDVVKALCLGAHFVFVGRPMLYAAALDGVPGVTHALDLVHQEVRRALALLGVVGVHQLGAQYLRRARI